MIPQSPLSNGGDGHRATEEEKREKREELEEATTIKEEIRIVLQGSKGKATENRHRKDEKLWKIFHSPLI